MMQQVDFLVTPTTAMLPWEFGTKTVAVGDTEAGVSSGARLARNTFPANYTGVPAITVPCGFSGGELPIGLQIMGRPWEESLVLRVAHQYEQAAPRSEAVPPAVRQALATE